MGKRTVHRVIITHKRTGNIRVIYEPTVASHVHIATCRGTDNTFMAFLVMHGNLLKTVWNPNLLAGDAKQTRSAAMLSLLESTEDRIRELLVKNNKPGKKTQRENKRGQNILSPKGERGRSMPPPSDAGSLSENGSLDYSIKPKEKEKSFLPWRRTSAAVRSESVYTQTG
jgi:hypothetical protein